MPVIYEMFEYKIIKRIFFAIITLICLIIVLPFLVIFLNVPTIFLTIFSTLAVLLSSIIALSIPFIMKNEQEETRKIEEQRKELKLIELIFKRLKKYFQYVLENPEEIHPAPTYPFFKYLSKTNADILVKLGIELNVYEHEGSKYHHLFLIDMYQINLGLEIYIGKGDKNEKVKATKKICQDILKDIVEYANKEHSLSLDPHLADFP